MKIYVPDYLWADGKFQKKLAVLCHDDTIISVGTESELRVQAPNAEMEFWTGLAMVPGSVNVHNHAFQVMLRGLACDRPFLEWRDQALYKYSPRFTLKDIYNSAVFDFSEMLRCGVTTVSEFFYLHTFGLESDEMIIQAAKDVGIRLVLARTMYDWDKAPAGYVETVSQAVERTKKLSETHADDPMVTVLPAPHSLHAASPEMIQAGHALAKELNTRFHIHVAEEKFELEQVAKEHGGLGTLEYLDTIGVVDERMTVIHGVWLKPNEIDLLGERGGNLAYCPSSNMYLADGITDLPRMMSAGVRIGLGCDGACANSRNSIFEEMRMASLLQKVHTCDAMSVNYFDVFHMGTDAGAELLQLPTGQIAAGSKADFVGIQTDNFSMQPCDEDETRILPNLIYAMQPDAVRRVVVGGRLVSADGNLLTVPAQRVLEGVKTTMKHLEECS